MNMNGIQPREADLARNAENHALSTEQRTLKERIPDIFSRMYDGPWRQVGDLRVWAHTRAGANDIWVWRLEHHLPGEPARILARSDIHTASSSSPRARNIARADALRELYLRVYWSRSASDPDLFRCKATTEQVETADSWLPWLAEFL